MTEVIREEDRFTAWLKASRFLLDGGDCLDLVLDISQPLEETAESVHGCRTVDDFYKRSREYPIHTVAETIFPGWEYSRHGLPGVFDRYPAQYELFRKGDSTWGRYAYRLVRREGTAGTVVNPLDNLIQKMRRANAAGRGRFRSCYEISVADPALDIPLYDDLRDSLRVRGAPCLMHLSFKLVRGSTHLTALYRSHDYRNKVLGNLLGLARLQACVANEVGASCGGLTIHSTLAYVDRSRGLGAFRSLVRQLSG